VSLYLPNQSNVQNADLNSALKDMGADFLNSYTQLVDGEKDPRNLLLLFAMDRVILLEFDVSAHIEVS
jgi:DNA repair/transcription protein MET18/MMS19